MSEARVRNLSRRLGSPSMRAVLPGQVREREAVDQDIPHLEGHITPDISKSISYILNTTGSTIQASIYYTNLCKSNDADMTSRS